MRFNLRRRIGIANWERTSATRTTSRRRHIYGRATWIPTTSHHRSRTSNRSRNFVLPSALQRGPIHQVPTPPCHLLPVLNSAASNAVMTTSMCHARRLRPRIQAPLRLFRARGLLIEFRPPDRLFRGHPRHPRLRSWSVAPVVPLRRGPRGGTRPPQTAALVPGRKKVAGLAAGLVLARTLVLKRGIAMSGRESCNVKLSSPLRRCG